MLPDIFWIASVEPLHLAMMPRPRAGDWLVDEIAGWRDAGIGLVISLLEHHEANELGLLAEAEECNKHGIEFISFPIVDRSVPSSYRDVRALVARIVTALQSNQSVGIHCRAGIGRSGLVAACVLLELGLPFADVFPALTLARRTSVPDTSEQFEWVRKFSNEMKC